VNTAPAIGDRVTLDPDKFPKHKGLVYVVVSAPRPDTKAGTEYVELVLATDSVLGRAAYTTDLRPAPEA